MVDFSFKKGALVELFTNPHTFVGRIVDLPQLSSVQNSESNVSGRIIIVSQLLVRKENSLGTVDTNKRYHVDPERIIAWSYINAEDLGVAKNYVSGNFIKFDDDGFSKQI